MDDHREYRFRVYGPEGSSEFRSRIAKAAFTARLIRVSDGPDLCYQKLMRALLAGTPPAADVITTDEADFLSYRDEHTPVPKRRASSRPPAPAEPAELRPRPPYRPRPRAANPVVAAPVLAVAEPKLGEGQRVSHTTFGLGVTTATTSTRVVVSFDGSGPKSFVASMLEVEVLSGPRTWETSARGVNRPRLRPDEPGESPTAR